MGVAKMHYRFDRYALDPDRRELREAHLLVPLEPIAFDILLFLVTHRDRIVSKTELVEKVWSRRCISDSAISSRMTAVRHAIGDDGRQQRLIKTCSRRGFRFIGAVEEEKRADRVSSFARPPSESAFIPPRSPTVAVMPFHAIGSVKSVEMMASGLVEDVATALSRHKWLTVKSTDNVAPAEFVVDGSLRRDGRMVRITARLVDPSDGAVLWSELFDMPEASRLARQGEAVTSLAKAVVSKLGRISATRADALEIGSLSAGQCYLRGIERLHRWNRSGIADALALFERSTELDPECAPGYAMAAYCYVQRNSFGWMDDRERESTECARLAHKAAELTDGDPTALANAAHAIAAINHDHDLGGAFVERALRADPTLGASWYVSGWLNLFRGRHSIAIEHLRRAVRLSETDPLFFKMQAAQSYAYMFLGRYDDGAALAERALQARPHYLTAMRGAAANHALAGRLGQARNLMSKVRASDPALSLKTLPRLLPFTRNDDLDKWAGALRLAGLPD